MKKALVLFSGGQDSTVCLHWALARYDKVYALCFDYGQRHSRELSCAELICDRLGVTFDICDVTSVLRGTSGLVNKNNQITQYKDVNSLETSIDSSFVPARNSLFLTIGINRAVILGCSTIVTGICQVDNSGFPDCRQIYFNTLSKALNLGIFNDETDWISFEAPLLFLSKKEIVQLAIKLPDCLDSLKYSHTCYNGIFPPCGKCHSCLLREQGFNEAGITDPLLEDIVNE